MTSFLLAISLLLNGIVIFSIIILYARQNRLRDVEKTQEKMVKEMEEMISSYLFEMKEENDAFIKQFQQIRTNSSEIKGQTKNQEIFNLKEENAARNGRQKDIDKIKSEAAVKTDSEWNEKVGNAFKKQAVKAYKSATISKEESTSLSLPNSEENSILSESMIHKENNNDEKTLTHDEIYRGLFVNQVKLLKNQGLSVDEIAKKMNKGKTEIELLLKFS